MADAVVSFQLLTDDYHRHSHLCEQRAVKVGEHACEQYHAVHTVLPEKLQRTDLTVIIVGSVDQKQLKALFSEHIAYALGHTGNALA